MKQVISLEFCTEKRPTLGEDAPPTLKINAEGDALIMAVYDGLGGAGSTLYTLAENRQASGAYLAAHCAKAVVEHFYELWNDEQADALAQELEDALKYSFLAYQKELNAPVSRLKSKLLKTLPTTLAGIWIAETLDERQKTCLEATAFWAGDSRCFFWEIEGLRQISIDDLNGQPDAFQNLHLDATITNCIHAEGNFVLHTLDYVIDTPTIFLVATDGCFGYVQTPMHFEYILLKTLMESNQDAEDWAERLKEQLLAITGDDTSLALVAWGFQTLEEIKHCYYPRYETLKKTYIDIWENETNENREQLGLILWETYKKDYYIYTQNL